MSVEVIYYQISLLVLADPGDVWVAMNKKYTLKDLNRSWGRIKLTKSLKFTEEFILSYEEKLDILNIKDRLSPL